MLNGAHFNSINLKEAHAGKFDDELKVMKFKRHQKNFVEFLLITSIALDAINFNSRDDKSRAVIWELCEINF